MQQEIQLSLLLRHHLVDKKNQLTPKLAIKAYIAALKAKKQVQDGTYKVAEENHFLVHVQGLLGKLPKSEDIEKTVGEHFDLLSAFQTYFLFEGDIYALTTYSCPLEKYGTYMLNEIDCYLVLGNNNLWLSRKDCDSLNELIQKENISNIVMLENTSPNAGQEAWPKQMEKEAENKDKNAGSIEKLKATLEVKNSTMLPIKIFSNQSVSLIFNHILKACILQRKSQGKKGNNMLQKLEEYGQSAQTGSGSASGNADDKKKCIIF